MDKMLEMAYKLIIYKISLPLDLFLASKINEILTWAEICHAIASNWNPSQTSVLQLQPGLKL